MHLWAESIDLGLFGTGAHVWGCRKIWAISLEAGLFQGCVLQAEWIKSPASKQRHAHIHAPGRLDYCILWKAGGMHHALWSTKQILENLSEGAETTASGATPVIPFIHLFPEKKYFNDTSQTTVYLGYGSIHCSRLFFILFIIIIYCTGQTFHLNVIFMNCKIFLFNMFICTYLYLEHPLGLALLKRASLLKWHQTPSRGWGLQPWLSKFWVRVEKEYPLIGQMTMHSFTFDQGWVSQLLFLWKQNPDPSSTLSNIWEGQCQACSLVVKK